METKKNLKDQLQEAEVECEDLEVRLDEIGDIALVDSQTTKDELLSRLQDIADIALPEEDDADDDGEYDDSEDEN